MAETLFLKGTLRGHSLPVLSIATPIDNTDTIVTSSMDKSLLLWTLTKESANSVETAGSTPYGISRRLIGHSDFVNDVVLSSDGQFALSGSQDHELRLWDLNTGDTILRFVGHTDDVLSVAFSVDNRQIVSGSRDHTIKIWNTLGECQYTIQGEDDGHCGWVNCVRFIPNILQPTIVSGSCDRTVKVWDLTNHKLKSTLEGHERHVHTVAVSPDGTLCASGGSDDMILMWDLAKGKMIYSLDISGNHYSLCFCPNRYWICAATDVSVKIFDLESESIVQELKRDDAPSEDEDNAIYCSSLSWSCDGSTLFTGYTDGIIRVWGISRSD